MDLKHAHLQREGDEEVNRECLHCSVGNGARSSSLTTMRRQVVPAKADQIVDLGLAGRRPALRNSTRMSEESAEGWFNYFGKVNTAT